MSAHVSVRGAGWAVRRSGAKRALRVFAECETAISAAKVLGLPTYIHSPNGRIERVIRENSPAARGRK